MSVFRTVLSVIPVPECAKRDPFGRMCARLARYLIRSSKLLLSRLLLIPLLFSGGGGGMRNGQPDKKKRKEGDDMREKRHLKKCEPGNEQQCMEIRNAANKIGSSNLTWYKRIEREICWKSQQRRSRGR
jgi:hypothetical protein